MPDLIRIEGLRELNRDLRKLDRDLPKGLRLAGNRAAEVVVGEARPRIPLGPGSGGHVRSSLRVASTRTSARVRGGGSRFPYFGWLDFGGARTGRGGGVARRPFLREGRYVWAAFADRRADVERELRDALTGVARDAGFDVDE